MHYIGVGTVTVTNSIIAGNIDFNDGNDPDLSGGTFTSGGNTLIGDLGSATGFTDGVNSDQVGSAGTPIDPLLGALADNGGPTQTHALLAGSTAINNGESAVAPLTDQLGNTRVASADIGAFEYGGGNAPPVNSIPGPQTINYGGMLLFSSTTGTALTSIS